MNLIRAFVIFISLFLLAGSASSQTNVCELDIEIKSSLNLNHKSVFLGIGTLTNGFSDGYIFIDVLGDFIVHYDNEGKKTHRFGRPGSGPGDLSFPIGIALNIPENEIFVADSSPYLSVFSVDTGSHVRNIEHGFSRVAGIINYSSGRFMMSAIERGKDITESELIHIYDFDNEIVEQSFHRLPELRDLEAMIYRSHNPVQTTIGQNGTVYVMNLFEPKIYKYDSDFNLIRKIKLDLDGFIPITEVDDSEFTDIRVATMFTTILRIKVLNSDYLIVNTYRPEMISNDLTDEQFNRTNYLVNLKDGSSCNLGISYKMHNAGKSDNEVYFSSSDESDLFYRFSFSEE